jgi:hypothetical protein
MAIELFGIGSAFLRSGDELAAPPSSADEIAEFRRGQRSAVTTEIVVFLLLLAGVSFVVLWSLGLLTNPSRFGGD